MFGTGVGKLPLRNYVPRVKKPHAVPSLQNLSG